MSISGPVQEVIGSTAVAAASYTIALAQAPTVGNSLILCAEDITNPITAVSGGGVTWAKAVSKVGTASRSEIWFGHNSDGTAGNITVNFTSKATSTGSGNVTEWAGLNNAVADATNSGSADLDANPATGAVTPAFANSLAIATAAWSANDYSSGPTGGFTRRTTFNDTVDFGEAGSKIVSTVAACSAAWVLNAGISWTATIAVFGAPDPAAASTLQRRPLADESQSNYYITTPS